MMIDLAKTLNEQIGEAANGNKDFEESFSRLGLKMDDLIKMSVDEQLLTVAGHWVKSLINQTKRK